MKILSTRPWEEWQKEMLRKADQKAVFLQEGPEASLSQLVMEADVLFNFGPAQIDPVLLAKSPTLKLVQVSSTGVDSFMVPEFQRSPILLASSRGVHAKVVADHAMALLLALTHNLLQCFRNQSKKEWKREEIISLEGKTAGLLGMGSIGLEIAARCKPFSMRVIGLRKDPDKPHPNVDKVYSRSEIFDFLAESDFVISSLPLTNETRASITIREFSAMKPSSIFINVGRGPVVKEDDLILALREGKILKAGLDVFETEPLPPESPLWQMENVIITPHIAGVHRENIEKSMAILAENLKRLMRGEPLVNQIDKIKEY